jgi:DNA modification methylase
MMINQTIIGDSLTVLKTLPDELVDCVVTSPPYWGLRDYGVEGQIGLEKTPEEYVAKIVEIFREVKRVLKKEGTCWLNLGDSYAGSGKGQGEQAGEKQKTNREWGKSPHDFGRQGETSTVSTLERGRGFYSGNGLKPKDLVGIPWRCAFALQADGWWLRQDIVWSKPNPMPESVTDRCTKSHEYIFLLTKSAKYFYDNEAIKESAVWDVDGNGTIARKERQKEGLKSNPTEIKNGIRITYPNGKHKDGQQSPKTINGLRNKRSVWTVTTKPYAEAHFATFPEALIEPMILAGSPVGGIVLDPFMGSGTTGRVATKLNRNWLGIELNEAYGKLIEKRTNKVQRFLL